MELRVKHATKKITIAEIIEEIFESASYLDDLMHDFLSNRSIAIKIIDNNIKYILGYDDDVILDETFVKADIDRLRGKVFDIMYSIAEADKESE